MGANSAAWARGPALMSGFGAVPASDGVHFMVWAPAASTLELRINPSGASCHPTRDDQGLWRTCVPDARPGDRYAYVLNGDEPRPDPASRFQPDGVHGWSEVVDPRAFEWTDVKWAG